MRCILEEELRCERYQDYVAVVQTNIGRLLCAYVGAEWRLPNYIEFMYPERAGKGPQTANAIKAYILQRLAE